jgi:hypothetical protein
MANVLSRLTTTFDRSKFGDDVELSTKAQAFLNSSPIKISSWASSDLSNGSIVRTDYFQNPVANQVSSITSNVNSIITLCTFDTVNSYPLCTSEIANLANSSNSLISQLTLFLDHTDRISGVSENLTDTETGATKPNYAYCIGTGGMLLTLTATTDNVRTAEPMLNFFTSLYISDELSANSWNIGNTKNSLQTIPSTLTGSQVNTMIDIVNSANTLIYQRRVEDENYFYDAQQIMEDYQFLNSLENAGSTERNLIMGKIGTTKLKNDIGS